LQTSARTQINCKYKIRGSPVSNRGASFCLEKDELPDETELAGILSIQQKLNEKYDEYLPEDLLTEGYGRKAFNSRAAKQWILTLSF
jgi:ATP-dependent Lhr-like helicase